MCSCLWAMAVQAFQPHFNTYTYVNKISTWQMFYVALMSFNLSTERRNIWSETCHSTTTVVTQVPTRSSTGRGQARTQGQGHVRQLRTARVRGFRLTATTSCQGAVRGVTSCAMVWRSRRNARTTCHMLTRLNAPPSAGLQPHWRQGVGDVKMSTLRLTLACLTHPTQCPCWIEHSCLGCRIQASNERPFLRSTVLPSGTRSIADSTYSARWNGNRCYANSQCQGSPPPTPSWKNGFESSSSCVTRWCCVNTWPRSSIANGSPNTSARRCRHRHDYGQKHCQRLPLVACICRRQRSDKQVCSQHIITVQIKQTLRAARLVCPRHSYRHQQWRPITWQHSWMTLKQRQQVRQDWGKVAAFPRTWSMDQRLINMGRGRDVCQRKNRAVLGGGARWWWWC